jgi:lysyl-tRNA synthetase, class II
VKASIENIFQKILVMDSRDERIIKFITDAMRLITMSEKENIQCHPADHHVEQEFVLRCEKVQELEQKNIPGWPENITLDTTCMQVKESYKPEDTTLHTIAGRVMTIRKHGKSIFAHIKDRSGALQIYIKQDTHPDTFTFFEQNIDLGDIITCSGALFETKTKEITLSISSCQLLSKCLHPLPAKFHGIADQEIKYRQRYLDLMTNDETKQRFIARSKIITYIRTFLEKLDFLEVETPMLHPIPGGAAARPFVTHHNALDTDFYLRISPELYLKRLVVGGLERVYEINRNFRNEGLSTRHNPEFTMLEFYMAYQDYHVMMHIIEQLLRETAQHVLNTTTIPYGENTIDFAQPFAKISPKQAIMQYSTITPEQLTPEAINATCKKYAIETQDKTYNQKMFALFEEVAEKKLIQPTFIIDYPIELSPLAKKDAHDPSKAARFELFIGGMEISNGFNELNDPFDQAQRFKEQSQERAKGDSEAMHYDQDYITALEYGLPPTVGAGLGIDRLTMLLTNTPSIKEVILFPALKHKPHE